MIRIIRSEDRFRTDLGWLKSWASFSFADHYDPDNTEFGPLKIFNHDTIDGNRGFGGHPHREMEIVSVVLAGSLKHEDSTGVTAVTGYGGVQRMSAGTGIIHSEKNPADEPCELMQIWIAPSKRGVEPSYETTSYDPEEMNGRLLKIVSGTGESGKIAKIHQDADLYLSRLEAGGKLSFTQQPGRRIYLYVIEGGLQLAGGNQLAAGDTARIEQLHELELKTAGDHAFLMLIDLP